jgi:hypothetical protein
MLKQIDYSKTKEQSQTSIIIRFKYATSYFLDTLHQ